MRPSHAGASSVRNRAEPMATGVAMTRATMLDTTVPKIRASIPNFGLGWSGFQPLLLKKWRPWDRKAAAPWIARNTAMATTMAKTRTPAPRARAAKRRSPLPARRDGTKFIIGQGAARTATGLEVTGARRTPSHRGVNGGL